MVAVAHAAVVGVSVVAHGGANYLVPGSEDGVRAAAAVVFSRPHGREDCEEEQAHRVGVGRAKSVQESSTLSALSRDTPLHAATTRGCSRGALLHFQRTPLSGDQKLRRREEEKVSK